MKDHKHKKTQKLFYESWSCLCTMFNYLFNSTLFQEFIKNTATYFVAPFLPKIIFFLIKKKKKILFSLKRIFVQLAF
ncbi:hypothetical protein BpHYR1_043326 [Brachionus plicatilis]|uniref:Uncharacterized protein n=1 Tax=Brachionus plicatilis TaxID=10195 RepID=A0A3M7QIW9_BRAPC|nr:hypothetical protein BpHYR1_043326 [Brachionus plicatilis]